ncbi:MAG: DUF2849 domain-containing protein [Kiloniellales bacterium]
MKAQVMTANRLDDGAVVYLDAKGCWIESLAQAAVAEDAEACQLLESEAARAVSGQLIVGPYLFAVAREPAGPRPLGQREIIRAAGPTVGTDIPANRPATANARAEG